MESTRPIRALTRGLDALTVLNLRDGASVSEVAHEIHLPRTTVYRILETLCNAGCAFRDPSDDRYRLNSKVGGLSDGFADEDWIVNIAIPCLHELGRRVVWPVAISTPAGTMMVVRESTDHQSPLATERYSAGFRFHLLDSASGRAYLAYCPASRRESVLAALSQSKKTEDKLARNPPEIERLLGEIKARGLALFSRTRRAHEDICIALPVMHDATVLAVLGIRIAAKSMSAEKAVDRFVPSMRVCARTVAARWAQKAVPVAS